MIFKVQQSLSTNASKSQMLIYDESRDYQYEADLTEEVKKSSRRQIKKHTLMDS